MPSNDSYDEAALVANQIAALVGNGARYRDIVVVICDYELTAPIFVEAFRGANIPVNVDVGGKLIEHALAKYIRDVMNNSPWVTSSIKFRDGKVSNLCANVKKLITTDDIVSEKIIEILDTIERILGEQHITVTEFNNMFCTLASACKISDVPKFADRVLLVSSGEYEPNFIPYLFITSATAELFPNVTPDTDIITEQDINNMSIRIEPSARLQNTRAWIHAHNIMQSATKGLYISYTGLLPTTLAKGFAVQNSLAPTSRAFARQQVLKSIGNGNAFADGESATWYASLYKAAGADNFKIPQLATVANVTDGAGLFFPKGTARVTQLENFLKCPYYHFLVNGLGMEKREPIGKISPAVVGTILHDIAEKIVRGEKWHSDNPAIKKQAKLMEKFLLDDIEQSKHKPKFFEHKLQKQIDGITIRGTADRVDSDGKTFRVVDYKTGGAGVVRLQVPLYMDMLGNAEGGCYLSLKDFTKKPITADDVAPAVVTAKDAIARIKKGDIQKCPINKSVCKYCPAGGMCE